MSGIGEFAPLDEAFQQLPRRRIGLIRKDHVKVDFGAHAVRAEPDDRFEFGGHATRPGQPAIEDNRRRLATSLDEDFLAQGSVVPKLGTASLLHSSRGLMDFPLPFLGG